MDWCQACSKDVACAVTMNGAAQFVKSCPECGGRVGQALSAPMADYDHSTERPMAVAAQRPPADVVHLPVPLRRGPSAILAERLEAQPVDVMAMVRSRLAYLEAEMAKRDGFAAESKKLRKMLAAADRESAKENR